ncbi:energy-coupling factor transporter transmembrane protein EcfT (plasmid) [Rhodococcus sp. USK10]|uniref:energy-coupling factor transporter transmembrane component T family protein n=1 Tax=Rhodococcus sp. USK10 TaxID=2789739 RepID=UPI001C606159|nr:energy-coupling factor transporter transmembrane component T [Rhodococcus sp. USK10]QYA99815.1 energy-coupling factor transporter transmembrane protein EcfT [Rhodococcus sp. USK10]
MHRLDPRVKLLAIAVVIAGTFLFIHPLALLIIFVLTLIPWVVGRINARAAWPLILGGLVMALGVAWTNAFFYPSAPGAEVLWQAGGVRVTDESLLIGLGNGIRLLLPMSISIAVILTTDPVMLSRGLTKLKVPFRPCFMFVSAVRFIPLVVEEAAKIRDAQRVRGVEGKGFGPLTRLRLMLVPLLAGSLIRARATGLAVETKAFGAGQWRDFYRDVRFRRTDWAVLVVLVMLMGVAVYLRTQGFGTFASVLRQAS